MKTERVLRMYICIYFIKLIVIYVSIFYYCLLCIFFI